MRSILKLVIAVAVYAMAWAMYGFSVANQHSTDQHSTILQEIFHSYDTVVSKFNKHDSKTAGLPPKALLAQTRAVEEQIMNLIEEKGCERGPASFLCTSLLLKDKVLKLNIVNAEGEWQEYELVQKWQEYDLVQFATEIDEKKEM